MRFSPQSITYQVFAKLLNLPAAEFPKQLPMDSKAKAVSWAQKLNQCRKQFKASVDFAGDTERENAWFPYTAKFLQLPSGAFVVEISAPSAANIKPPKQHMLDLLSHVESIESQALTNALDQALHPTSPTGPGTDDFFERYAKGD